jgi:ABC-type transport system involved in cytochrome c biogenesis permease component
MPVVIGQPIVALCFRASAARIWFIVTSFPSGTLFISASTSLGAGITTVPTPQRLLILLVIFSTFGKPLSSFNFSVQVFFFGIVFPISGFQYS